MRKVGCCEPSSNPAVDAALLNYMLLPAVVCTADKKFINAVRQIPLPDALRLMTPAELLAWLKTGSMAGCRSNYGE